MDYRTFLYNAHHLLGQHALPTRPGIIQSNIQEYIDSIYASGDRIEMNEHLKIVSVQVEMPEVTSVHLEWIREWLEPARYDAPKDAIPLLKSGRFDVYLMKAPIGYFALKLDGENAMYCAIDACAQSTDPVFQQAVVVCQILGLKTVI